MRTILRTSCLRACEIAALLFALGAANSAEPIIDTHFDNTTADGALQATGSAATEGDLPLKTPTQIQLVPSSAGAPSSATRGSEAIGSLRPPYALLQAGEREDAPGTVAGVVLNWDLRKLGLSSGVYKLSYDALARQDDKNGGWFAVNFVVKPAYDGPPIHPTNRPISVRFGGKQIFVAGSPVRAPSVPDESHHYEITIDLDKKTWAITMDGNPWIEATPFPDFLNTGGETSIGTITFGSTGGLGDSADAAFAIANVKLLRAD